MPLIRNFYRLLLSRQATATLLLSWQISLFASEYKQVIDLQRELHDLLQQGAYVKRGD